MVPEGWQELPIGKVCSDIIDCVNKTASVVAEETPFKMIRTTNVRNGRVDTENVRYVSEETFRVWTRRGRLRTGDVILTREAPVGEVGQLIEADGMFLGQRTMLYRADPQKMVQSFLFQMMISPLLKEQYVAASAGGTVHHIRVPDCSKFIVKVPPLPEQQKIAEILSTWDKAIETTEALLANARTQKRALMQSLLTGTRRFREFEGQPWREVRLGDVAEIRKGEQKSKNTLGAGGKFPVINGGVSPSGYSDEWNTVAGTITISEGGNSCGFANLIDVPFWSGGHCYTLEKLRIDRDYLFHWLKFQEAEIMRLRVGSGLPNIQKKAIASFPVAVPSGAEQVKIAAAISCTLVQESAIEAELDYLRTEKKSLMQQLLTGKRRVSV